MAWVRRAVFGVLITLALCGCTCGLAGCTSAEAKTSRGSRFDVEYIATNSNDFMLDHMVVDLITDTETGRQWMVVCTNHGVALTPLGEE